MINDHPIENLMSTAMNSIKDMIDVDTIIGDPIETANNMTIIPISKVGFGFAAGGSEFNGGTLNEYSKKEKEEELQYKLPFGGGSGAGVSISPIAFLVVGNDTVKLLPVNHNSCIDRLMDYIPDLMEKVNDYMNHKQEGKKQVINIEEVDELNNKNINNISNKNPIVRPKKNTKMDKPKSETYEYEYDETDEEDEP